MKPNVICKKCGKNVSEIYEDNLCFNCYSENWDNSFSSTTDWSAKSALSDMFRNLNSSLESRDHAIRIIDDIINDFQQGNWSCLECSNVIINQDLVSKLDAEQIYTTILNDHKCCNDFYLTMDYKGEK